MNKSPAEIENDRRAVSFLTQLPESQSNRLRQLETIIEELREALLLTNALLYQSSSAPGNTMRKIRRKLNVELLSRTRLL